MKKITKKAATLELQEEIKSLILEKNLKPGDLMPTENELIELLGVSRSSLREAIKSLEALHILDIHHGIGTFVGESSLVPMIRGLAFHAQLHLQNDLKCLLDILDVREILQYGFAPLALAKISDQAVEQLQQLVATIEQNARDAQFSVEEEQQVHLLIYRSTENQLLLQYLDAFWQIYQLLDHELPPNNITPTALAMQYRDWVDAIEARDLERTQHAILVYFQGIRRRLTATV
ncbi:FadR/GntR family transcriptional regulator [Testudinibacter sp. TR-2022]|uniref:FadR/GntR family transcriptional regulator n=1 Tax=Testudinibacter sp. TR-2022 TaxID=2585029 RepID=UPI0011193103|nr:FadR/GntR family transcriptional regulator [Testudinibacter sp. TR-2022]TNH07272.1 FadR family transcriptional regulator [Pasteurellaceae bacterium Phil11]TNH23776.1 FadR family transcriptional regulator [Testudinibacter sp. TR-2022]TNH27763.1 FadR family transcriptional regulator [Testudinibacter sp. TR-2022]